MPSRFSANDTKPTARAAIGRRRRAGWLLVGWLAFWLTTAAQPFEHSFTGKSDHRSAVSTPTSGGQLSYAEHGHEPAPDDSHCPDVSAVMVETMLVATCLYVVYPSSSSPVPVTQRDGEMRNLKSHFPPPPSAIPLYLRTQRLLI